jgi:hypothetical protein
MKRSGLTLALAGLLGVAFFWATDPTLGWGARWLSADNPIDVAREARFPTMVGLVGSLLVFVIGVWLGTRRPT